MESDEETRHEPHDTQEDQRPEAALVSVVIPCYNQAHFLSEAIESVLAQSYQHFEIVVVDDGSSDNTSEVAAHYPGVSLIQQQNQGLSAARNTGIRHSKGSYLVFLDADDRLLPKALEAGLKCFEDHPDCAFVCGRYVEMAADGTFLRLVPRPPVDKDYYPALLRHNYIGPPAVEMYRRFVFDTVGGFDSSLSSAEDYDHNLRVARKFPIYPHDEVIAEYRVHGTSMSRNYARMLRTSMDVLGSQWKYVRGNEQLEQAYKAGMRSWQRLYGTALARKIPVHVRKREWKQAIGDLLILLKYYPKGLALLSKRRRIALRLQFRSKQLRNRDQQLEASEQRLRNRTKQLEAIEQRLRNRTKQLQRLEEQNQNLTQRLQNLEQQMQK